MAKIILEFDFEKYFEEVKEELTPVYIAKMKWAYSQKKDELIESIQDYMTIDIPDAIYECIEDLWIQHLEADNA